MCVRMLVYLLSNEFSLNLGKSISGGGWLLLLLFIFRPINQHYKTIWKIQYVIIIAK